MIGSGMIFRRFTVGSYPINGYLLADAETHIGVFIDPGGFHEEIAAYIEHAISYAISFLRMAMRTIREVYLNS